ncbi:hypothetical protein [Massilia antarctica]|uniref:hypothetical protein n=1 Tax=Massilia antarctica TaxID=2765360 RepID=UPI0022702FC2|nr:hypothetical protein [Massilia sp. H27-R4]MCY0916244.1 hypothetical protein [Massilia sp. H27-R4]
MMRLLMLWMLCVAASAYAGTRMLYLIARNPRKAWSMAVAHDQLANAATNGHMDETISSRANRARTNGRRWGCVLCRLLDRIDKDHCTRSAGT